MRNPITSVRLSSATPEAFAFLEGGPPQDGSPAPSGTMFRNWILKLCAIVLVVFFCIVSGFIGYSICSKSVTSCNATVNESIQASIVSNETIGESIQANTENIQAPTVSSAEETDLSGDLQQYLNQMNELRDVGCKPVEKPYDIGTLLPPDDDLPDKDSHPKVVVLKKCLPSMSYCKTGRCQSSNSTVKEIIFACNDCEEGSYVRRYFEEDTECVCS